MLFRYFIFIFLFFVIYSLKAQETSLYYKNGSLKFRPDLIIDSTRMHDINIIEDFYLPQLYNRIKAPKFYIDNGINTSTIVKMKISFEDSSINFKFIRKIYYQSDQYDSIEITNAINDTYLSIFTNSCFNSKKDLVFYVPIIFEFSDKDIDKMMFDNKAIKIEILSPSNCRGLYGL